MDPKHRDRIAFLRVCSGKFERDMVVTHQRIGRQVSSHPPTSFSARSERPSTRPGPGDVIGLVGHDAFGIGDTLTEDRTICYDEIPRFPPEVFTYISNPNPADSKKNSGPAWSNLLQERRRAVLYRPQRPVRRNAPGRVGPLQFEVVQYRLQAETTPESRLTPTPWTLLKWLEPHPSLKNTSSLVVASGVSFGADKFGQPVALFPNDWTMRYFTEKKSRVETPRSAVGAIEIVVGRKPVSPDDGAVKSWLRGSDMSHGLG